MRTRAEVLGGLAEAVDRAGPGRLLVGIDGVDGVGKTTFADDLVAPLESRGRPVVRVRLDDFLNPRAVRYRLGRDSPEGFVADTYDLEAFRVAVVDGLARGAVRTAVFDHRRDVPVPGEVVAVPHDGVVLVDGLFLHRPELVAVWHLSVLLIASLPVTVGRLAERDGSPPDPADPRNRRYVEGQRVARERWRPQDRADVVLDVTDLAAPSVVRWAGRAGQGALGDIPDARRARDRAE